MQANCGFGHIYDSDQYASCPYCNRGTRAIFFGSGGSGRISAADVDVGGDGVQGDYQRTVAPSYPDSVDKTVAPGGPSYVSDNTIGKTEIPDYLKKQMETDERNKTIGIFKKKTGLDPMVGWLVCIEGPEKGSDYRLFNRINTIGRGEDNDVVIRSEQTISQKSHAKLAYDEKHNNYQMIPGDGRNITYVNDVPLYVPQLLHAYDVIEFGETKLIFIPLCSEQFHW